MWTDCAALTKQLVDQETERAAIRTARRSYLADLDPECRERLDQLRGEIERGEIAYRRRDPRGGRPATDEERRRREPYRRRDPMQPTGRRTTKADLIVAAVHARPDETYAVIAASLGVSCSYLKHIAHAEGIRRQKGRRPKPEPRPVGEGPTDDDRRYYAWGLLQTATHASHTTIAEAAGLSVDAVRVLGPGRLSSRGRKPRAPAVAKRGAKRQELRVVAPVAPGRRQLNLATREGIVEMARSGLTVEEIAAQLGVFEATVRFHIRAATRSRNLSRR